MKASPCLLLDSPHHSLRDLPGSPQRCGPLGANGDGYQSPPRDPAAGLRPSGGELGPPSGPHLCTALSKTQPRLLGRPCPPHLTPFPSPQAFQVSVRSTQGPIDVFLCPEDSSGVCSPVKSPFKASAEESSPSHSQPRASPLLHPAQDVNMPLLPGEQGGWWGLGTGGSWGQGCWCDGMVALARDSCCVCSCEPVGTGKELQ